jgi:hypothetical protein
MTEGLIQVTGTQPTLSGDHTAVVHKLDEMVRVYKEKQANGRVYSMYVGAVSSSTVHDALRLCTRSRFMT